MYDFDAKFGDAAAKYARGREQSKDDDAKARSKKDSANRAFGVIRDEITKPALQHVEERLQNLGIVCKFSDLGSPGRYLEASLEIEPKIRPGSKKTISFYTDSKLEKLFCSTQFRDEAEPAVVGVPLKDAGDKFVHDRLDTFLHTVLNTL